MVYLIHFDQPYKHARHYLGFCKERLEERIDRHRRGDGANLLRYVNAAGISYKIVRIWDQDRHFERRLKKNGHVGTRYCPVCRGENDGQII
jgi:hypothetical protein